jgi:uncharacterized protein (TIGR03067 family)
VTALDLLNLTPASGDHSSSLEEVEQMLRKIVVLGVAALLITAARAPADQSAKSSANLTGEYKIVQEERDGQRVSADQFQDSWVNITDDTITIMDKNKTEKWSANYKLDSSRKPCMITLTEKAGPNKGETVRGIAEKEGDTVKIIFAMPGGPAPTSFDATKEKQKLLVLKRENK